MAKIKLVDVSIRDGNQSLWGATGLNTGQILQIAPTLDRVGFYALDFTSSTHMGIAVRTHKQNPWELIRGMHRRAPNTPLQYITTGMRFISWEASDNEFMRLVYRCLVNAGMRRFIMLDPMHDLDALLRGAKTMKEEGGEVMGALTYTISAVHDDKFYGDLAAEIAKSPYFDRVYIKDPAGMLTPDRARSLIKEVKSRIGAMPLELHSHCTIGLSPLVCMIGAELGVEVIHVAIGPLSNGTSLPSATRMIANLREHGHEVDIDEEALARVSDYFERLADAETLPKGTPQEYDAAFLRHQVPGGVMTTTRRQLKELGLEDKFSALIEEVERVRAELGYPIMVTPFPQMVVGQALANIMGAARYANISDQVIRYVLEKFGRPTAPVDPDIKDKILSSPRAKELAAEPPPPDLKELRRKFPADMPDEEFLLRVVMPSEQVDAMMATGPANPHYNPDSRTVISLVKELTTRKGIGEISIEKPDFRLSLKAGAATSEAAE